MVAGCVANIQSRPRTLTWLEENAKLSQHCRAILVNPFTRQAIVCTERVDTAKRDFHSSPGCWEKGFSVCPASGPCPRLREGFAQRYTPCVEAKDYSVDPATSYLR